MSEPKQIGLTEDGQPIYAWPQQYVAHPPACQHQAPVQQPSGGAARWIGIGVGASIFLVTVAISAVAVAISAVSLTICVLVLRSMWTDFQKGKGR